MELIIYHGSCVSMTVGLLVEGGSSIFGLYSELVLVVRIFNNDWEHKS